MFPNNIDTAGIRTLIPHLKKQTESQDGSGASGDLLTTDYDVCINRCLLNVRNAAIAAGKNAFIKEVRTNVIRRTGGANTRLYVSAYYYFGQDISL